MKGLLENLALPSEGLSLFRRALGALCLADALQRCTQATLLYSDLGVLPRSYVYALFDTEYSWSVYLLSGQPLFAIALLLLTALLGGAQMLGRERRASRVALWILILSVQNRHPGLLDSADDLLRLLLFWDMLLPNRLEPGQDVVSLSTMGLQLQLSVTLLATAWQANPERWLLAAQWGEATPAARFPWLGLVPAVALPAIWWRKSRPVLVLPAALALLLQGLVLHPALPLTVLAGLLCLAAPLRGRPVALRQVGVLAQSPRPRLSLALGGLLCLAGPAWWLWPGLRVQPPLAALGGVLGLHQDWSRAYPLASTSRAELILRAVGYPQPLYKLGKDQGRRLRLMSQTLLTDLRLARPLSLSFAERAELSRPVNVWLRVDTLAPDMTLIDPQIWQLDSVSARAAQSRDEGPL